MPLNRPVIPPELFSEGCLCSLSVSAEGSINQNSAVRRSLAQLEASFGLAQPQNLVLIRKAVFAQARVGF